MQKATGIGVLTQTRLSFAHCDVWGRFPMEGGFFVLSDKSCKDLLLACDFFVELAEILSLVFCELNGSARVLV